MLNHVLSFVLGLATGVGLTIVIAFGLLIGTILTLAVVPVLYSLFFRAQIPGSQEAVASVQPAK